MELRYLAAFWGHLGILKSLQNHKRFRTFWGSSLPRQVLAAHHFIQCGQVPCRAVWFRYCTFCEDDTSVTLLHLLGCFISEAKCSLNHPSKECRTCIHYACWGGHLDVKCLHGKHTSL